VQTLEKAQMIEHENKGRLVVPRNVRAYLDPQDREQGGREDWMEQLAELSQSFREKEFGGTPEAQKQRVIDHARKQGREGFIVEADTTQLSLERPDEIPASMWLFVGLILLWWFLMLVLQGEGLELDFQRRRYPMWEWLLSHPVRPVAAFSAEMLVPFMANPVNWVAPLFWCVVWSSAHGFGWGAVAGAVLVGIPLAAAASCLHKALEIAAFLRLSSLTRGAVLGLMSCGGYFLMILPFSLCFVPEIKRLLLRLIMPVGEWFPAWPARLIVTGGSQTPVLWQAVSATLVFGLLVLAGAVVVAWWGTQSGIQPHTAAITPAPRTLQTNGGGFLNRHPLYRKELLWFWRDKSAVVQAILIPLTIGLVEVVFHLRDLAVKAAGYWNGVCGLGILCGSYFLLHIGPRSLAAEGPALWMTLTWPQGLADLLKAKARLSWLLANGIVAIAFAAALVFFPADTFKILLVGMGWIVFSHSLADKAVTLVTAPSSSGEMEPAPAGRQWAAPLGTLSFGSGVLTQNWHAAFAGMVFSSLIAAAMWQDLRARLPFLFDPWSEKLPQAPTLMHALIGVTILVEVMSICTGLSLAFGGVDVLYKARAIAYGVVGFAAWAGMESFLSRRGVSQKGIWHWNHPGTDPWPSRLAVPGGIAAGVLLASVAAFYLRIAQALPGVEEQVRTMHDTLAVRGNWWWMFLLAVAFAPVAEEFFFRGLLYRALDREWGGWAALTGSAAFFAIYHPPLSWPPVFAVGLANAWLFKKTGRLSACVALHMAYNAVVLLLT
jgi:membrane protease YdiL (CAAX protease family)